MQRKITLISILFISFFSALFAQNSGNETLVSSVSEFKTAMQNATAGDQIIFKNGVYSDAYLLVKGTGTKEAPIVVKAETPGGVIFNGSSKMKIAGSYLEVQGFWFKDGVPTDKYVISFRENETSFASNSRLTNCTISNYNPTKRSFQTHWVDLWGKNNRVDHNNFTGKSNMGTTLVVWLKGDAHIQNNHRIDNNEFGHRPPLGENGGETIRIGTSTNSMKSSQTLVENNTFKNCNGEIEIISNKSGDNIFRNNLFLESEGTLTLRHGNNALVEGNVFVGNDNSQAGGIRIINAGHIVRNNLLIGLKGDDYRGPIVFMNGVPNSPLNRYHQVQDVQVYNNTLINCNTIEIGAGKDSEKSLAPINSVFANNLITNTTGAEILNINDYSHSIKFEQNVVDADSDVSVSGFSKASLEWQMIRSLPVPSATNEILNAGIENENTPKRDITGRKKITNTIGAYNLGNRLYPRALSVKAGPTWKPVIEAPKKAKRNPIIEVALGEKELLNAIKDAENGDTLILSSGAYLLSKSIKINKSITIKGASNTARATFKSQDDLPKEISYFIRVQPKTTLTLENINFDGLAGKLVKYAIVSPDENEKEAYSLFVRNCDFINFKNTSGGAIFKAYVNTFADSLVFENAKFIDSYRGLNLSYQKDGFNTYNAETIHIKNSIFNNIEEFAINYSKSPFNDINTGGELLISNSLFRKIGKKEKNYILKANGIHKVRIENSIFENSPILKKPFSLSGASQGVYNSLAYSVGYIEFSDNAIKENVYYKNPKWDDYKTFVPSSKSLLLEANNKIAPIGPRIEK